VIEDSGDCGIEEWIMSQDDPRIHFIRHASNKGLASARNTALGLARGSYFAILDDDDYWLPQKLERQLSILTEAERKFQNVAFISSWVFLEQGANRKLIRAAMESGSLRQRLRYPGPQTPSSSLLFRTAFLRMVSGFDSDLSSSIDHDIWMKCCHADGISIHLNEGLTVVEDRSFRQTMMNTTDSRIRGVEQFIEKWHPWIVQELGERDTKEWCLRYRAEVYSSLAALKIKSGALKEAKQVVSHLIDQGVFRRPNIAYRAIRKLSSAAIKSLTSRSQIPVGNLD
jgi:glycosyltransferase involved in cell wall biosynthesis